MLIQKLTFHIKPQRIFVSEVANDVINKICGEVYDIYVHRYNNDFYKRLNIPESRDTYYTYVKMRWMVFSRVHKERFIEDDAEIVLDYCLDYVDSLSVNYNAFGYKHQSNRLRKYSTKLEGDK